MAFVFPIEPDQAGKERKILGRRRPFPPDLKRRVVHWLLLPRGSPKPATPLAPAEHDRMSQAAASVARRLAIPKKRHGAVDRAGISRVASSVPAASLRRR
jgi:hypothetical protein